MCGHAVSGSDTTSGACLMQKMQHTSIAKGLSEHEGNKVHYRNNAYSLSRPKSEASLSQSSTASAQKGIREHAPDLHAVLPEPILALAWTIFKTSDAIADIVQNSVLVNLTHGDINMTVRMHKEDDAVKRLGEEGNSMSYDLDKLGEVGNKSTMLNMIDIGGNYGVIAIAAMKKYKNRLRVVSVEPAPRTFFFLKWNLYINNITEIQKEMLGEGKMPPPGVLALNSGTSDIENQDLKFCFYKDSSMNSKICDCDVNGDGCIVVPSITVDKLANMFGNQPIAMVKMDCEGCEFKALPALLKANISSRVQSLAGELHLPDQNLELLACHWDGGRQMSKCQRSPKDENNIECGVALTCAK
jgi:FkbM family methyltransferase